MFSYAYFSPVEICPNLKMKTISQIKFLFWNSFQKNNFWTSPTLRQFQKLEHENASLLGNICLAYEPVLKHTNLTPHFAKNCHSCFAWLALVVLMAHRMYYSYCNTLSGHCAMPEKHNMDVLCLLWVSAFPACICQVFSPACHIFLCYHAPWQKPPVSCKNNLQN